MDISKVTLNGAEVSSILGVAIPFVLVVLTKLGVKLGTKSAVAIVLGAAASYGGSLAGTGQITGTQLILGFVGALAVAGGTRLSVTAQWVDKLAHATPNFGIGKKATAVVPAGTTPVSAPDGLDKLPGLTEEHITALNTSPEV